MTTTEQPEAPKTDVEAPETNTAAPKDSILTKPATPLHRRYTLYIAEKFGFTLPGAEVPADFFEEGNESWEQMVKLVQIAVVRYGEFQRSPENGELKAMLAERAETAAAAAREAKEKAAKEKAEAKAKAEAEKPAKGESKAAEGSDEPKTRKPAGKAAASKVEAPF